MKKLEIKNLSLAFAVIIAVAFLCLPAQAATVSYFLDLNNAGLPDDNYLQVTISDGTDGDIDFLVEVIGDAFPAQGSNFGMDKFFFNFDNGDSRLTRFNIVSRDPNWRVRRFRRASEFGRYQIMMKGNGRSRTDMLTFSIEGIDGDSPEDYAADNEGWHGSDEFFAAHIAGFFPDNSDGSGCTSYKPFSSAFFAGSTSVPIPGAVVLLGSGLLGLIAIRRRARN